MDLADEPPRIAGSLPRRQRREYSSFAETRQRRTLPIRNDEISCQHAPPEFLRGHAINDTRIGTMSGWTISRLTSTAAPRGSCR
jgi:hypothetical protein